MSQPLPIIYLPRMADHERLVRALWDLGCSYGANRTADQSIARYLDDVAPRDGETMPRYPCLALHAPTRITAFRVVDSAYTNPSKSGRTMVNSISHFLAYTRRLKATQLSA